ncbi:hypothetical protein [Clostridium intestinale]|uniref:Nuclease SbcCD subunit C n=1 Tax=Clostridium intestinale TaxID=36845 RepID=A0A7D6VTS6_9CLOT|nr:hypothetical protein [Clostridium intestinale]QLY78972.1 hypothetical protein HZF06_18070 [Clostridium intestinale]
MSNINRFLIKNVHIKNFRGYKEKEYIFSDEQIILLGGPNGYGKTSLLDAIEWVMTGTVKRIADEYKKRKDLTIVANKKGLIAHADSDINSVYVKMIIQLDDDRYTLVRVPGERPDVLLKKENSILTIIKQDGTTLDYSELFSLELENRFNINHICTYEKNVHLYEMSRNDMYEFFETYFIDNSSVDIFKEKLNSWISEIDIKIQANSQKAQENKNKVDVLQESYQMQESVALVNKYDSALLTYKDEVLNIKMVKENFEELKQKRELYLNYNEYLKEKKIISYYDIKNKLDNFEEEIYKHREVYFNIYIKAREWDNERCDKLKEQFEKSSQEIENFESNIIGVKNSIKVFKQIENLDLFNTDDITKVKEEFEECISKENEYNILNERIKLLEEQESTHEAMGKLLEFENDWKVFVKEKNSCPLCGRGDLDVKSLQESLEKVKNGISNSQLDLAHTRKKKKEFDLLIRQQKQIFLLSIKKRASEWKKEIDNMNSLYRKCVSYEKKLLSYNISLEEISLSVIDEKREFYKESLSKIEISDENKLMNETSIRNSHNIHKQSIENSNYKNLISIDNEFDSKIINEITNVINSLEGIIKRNEGNKYLAEYNEIKKIIKNDESLKTRINNLRKDIESAVGIYESGVASNVNIVINDIYKKISRHSYIDKVKIERPKGMSQNVNITVQNNVNFSNIMSSGQLTTFALSLFIGMAMLNNEPNFKAYFFDDPIQSMDDLNILSFVDLLKNQIKDPNGFAEQIFITTCDYEFVNLLKYKMEAGQIKVKYFDFMKCENE